MKNIITISRQFGAGGSTIGQAVAECINQANLNRLCRWGLVDS